jgi:hypothetical protein
VVTKNRHLSFVPGNSGEQAALRVTWVDLPAPFDGLNGQQMWVGQPHEYCENSGQVEPPGCGPAAGLDDITFLAATLVCDPAEAHYTDWSQYGTIHVYHESVIPGGAYEIQTVNQSCDLGDELSYSLPLAVYTSVWGDTVSNCATDPCGPPDGVVNVPTDVTAILDKFRNLPGAPTKARCDLAGTPPTGGILDFRIGILDVTWGLTAFGGGEYPFPPPAEPCGG